MSYRAPARDPATDLAPTLELILLGTGGSAAVPDISCVTQPRRACETCLSAIDGTVQGERNKRGNTGAVLRVPQPDGSE